jgi:hypothetical protein
MKRYLFLFLILFASAAAVAQEKPIRIGEIEFFGYAGVDLQKVRAALPFLEGDEINRETWLEKMERAQRAVTEATGKAPTDVGAVCCDERGNLSIFIGLSGSPMRYLPAPQGAARLPSSIINLYEQSLHALEDATRRGVAFDDPSKGYSLSGYMPLRAVQLKIRAYALHHEALLRDVLASSSDQRQRGVAAEALGYARRSRRQLAALARASRDGDSGVRNNATRALVILIKSDLRLANQIPAKSFIEMLLSETWTDINKASALLSDLTRGRNAVLLAQLSQPLVRERLIEMARWRTGHANPAKYILGRIAGIEETRLEQLVTSGQVDLIIGK